MDFRSVLDRATDKFRSVFSRDNSFFYGTAEQEARQQNGGYDQAPQQGMYPNPSQQGAAYAQPGYQEPAAYQAAPQAYANPYPYQQPYAQAPQQPVYQPPQQDPYAMPGYQQQAAPQQLYQQQVYQQPAPQQPARSFASPQQAQLQQQAAPQDGTVRNRRAAQHQQLADQPPESNVVPFPGAPMPEAQEARQIDAYVINITGINGCRQAMTCLRKGQCTLVVMDQLVDKAEVRRYVDMLNGACFALGGTMTRLSLKVGFYILAPSGMMVYTDPVTASANAQPRPQPAASYAAPQGYQPPFQAPQQSPYAAAAPQQPQYPPQQTAYQAGGYAPPAFQQGTAYAQNQGSYEAGYEEDRYAQ